MLFFFWSKTNGNMKIETEEDFVVVVVLFIFFVTYVCKKKIREVNY